MLHRKTFLRLAASLLLAPILQRAGLVQLGHGAASFNWANRLMLSLGEPAVKA